VPYVDNSLHRGRFWARSTASFSEVVGSQISLDGVQPRDMKMPWWSLPVI